MVWLEDTPHLKISQGNFTNHVINLLGLTTGHVKLMITLIHLHGPKVFLI